MKRVEEKVKDIIDVRPFSSLYDFAADPVRTLEGYHFTDITADLMAKWLDMVASTTAGQEPLPHWRAFAAWVRVIFLQF